MITRRRTIDKPPASAPPAGYAAAVLSDAPLAYYRAAAGSIVPDESGNGHDAALNGVSVIAGPEGAAFSGFASDHLITIPDSLVLDSAKSCTIEMLYRIAENSTNNDVFTIGNNGPGSSDGPACRARVPDAAHLARWLYCRRSYGGERAWDYASHWGEWTHICLVADDALVASTSFGEMAIWLNGVNVNDDWWGPGSASIAGGYIGGYPAGVAGDAAAPTAGDIAEFAVYDRALTGAQIAIHNAAR